MRLAPLLLAAAPLGLSSPPIFVPPAFQEAISVSSTGVLADSYSGSARASADARWVAFDSLGTNLVPGDTNATQDVFLRDRQLATTTRVSVSSGGSQADGRSFWATISADGRFVTFVSSATNLVAGDTNGADDVFVHDRQTGATTRVSVATGGAQADDGSTFAEISADGRVVVFVSTATNLVPGDSNFLCPGVYGSRTSNCADVFVHDLLSGTTRRISTAVNGSDANAASNWPSVSANGCLVAFTSYASNLVSSDVNGNADVFVYDCATGRTSIESAAATPNGTIDTAFAPTLSPDGQTLAFSGVVGTAAPNYTIFTRDRLRGRTTRQFAGVPPPAGISATFVSDRGRWLAAFTVSQFFVATTLVDLTGGTASSFYCLSNVRPSLPFVVGIASCGSVPQGSASGQVVLVTLDTDADGIFDEYERAYGLDPASAADAAADPDGDGLTNLQEFAAGSHPRGLVRRYFAEGVTGGAFRTFIDVFNPTSQPSTVLSTFQRADGTTVRGMTPLVPFESSVSGSEAIGVAGLPGLEQDEFSTLLESDTDVVATRTVDWGADRHADSAIAAPSPTWYFAEGATHSGFQLFYLLQNPGDVAASVTATWMRPAPAPPVTTTYQLAPHSRRTIWVNLEIAALASSDVAASFDADRPIVAERAMYVSSAGGALGAGHGAAGSPAPAASWSFAEGATGNLFDLFLLVATPGSADATVGVSYLLPDGSTVSRQYPVAAHARRTIWVDYEDARLANTAVSMTVTSTNGVPIVAERAMWWPGPTPSSWIATHVSHGATAAGALWAYAGAEELRFNAAGALSHASYVLVANTSPFPGEIQITQFRQYSTVPETRTVTVPPSSRYTLLLASASGPLGTLAPKINVLVESVGATPADIVVEVASYVEVGGVPMRAGTNALAQRLR